MNNKIALKRGGRMKFLTVLILYCCCVVFSGAPHPAIASDQEKIPHIRQNLKPLDLKQAPGDEELMAAGQLGGQLHPTHVLKEGKKKEAINKSFGEAMQRWNKHEYREASRLFRRHAKEYPDSPWAAEAILHCGCDATYNGRFREAEQDFQWVLDQAGNKDHEGAHAMRNKALLRLAVLRINQNRIDDAREVLVKLRANSTDWRERTFASTWLQALASYDNTQVSMFNCGIRALAHVLQLGGREEEARRLLERQPSTALGDSLADLRAMAAEFGYPLTALRLRVEELAQVSLPAIVQVGGRESGTGHYWILEEFSPSGLSFLDPQSGTRHQQSREEFAREWDGIAMTFGAADGFYANRLSEEESRSIYGGCCGAPPPPPQPIGQPGDGGRNGDPPAGPSCALGAPAMSVNLVNLNLYVTDTPLWYETPVGPDVRVTVSYNSLASIAQSEPFGNKWQLNYGSYLIVATNGAVTLFMPDGSQRLYNPDGSGGYVKPYRTWDQLVRIGSNHFELRTPAGEVNVYDIPAGTASMQPFLVEQRDAYGQSLRFGYNQNIELTSITDAQGKVTTLTYNGLGLVETVTDPFGRAAHFEYDILRNLRVITDMGGYVSRLTYDQDVYLASLGNDRGTWQVRVEPADGLPTGGVRYPAPGGNMGANARLTLLDPNGGTLEYYYDSAVYTTWKVSQNNYVQWVGSALNNFTKAAKTTYSLVWMGGAAGIQHEISAITNPDGGVTSYFYNVTTGDRLVERDPFNHDYTYTYNAMGRVTSVRDPKGTLTSLTYAANGVDLERVVNGLGTLAATYNGSHDITSITDRLGQRTGYAYNGYGQLTGITDPLSITTGLEYNSEQQLSRVTRDGQVLTDLSYDDKGRVRSGTTAAGLLLTLDYSDLNLVNRVTFPDGRFIYTDYAGCCPRLVTSRTDRGGKTTTYEYDALKRRTAITGPGGEVSRFEYDPAGNLTRFIDPNTNITSFSYDLVGRLTGKKYADGTGESYIYNKAGLVTQRLDARGIKTDYTYDVNDNLTAITYGDETPDVTLSYDLYNRLVTLKDGSGTTAAGYDANSQLTSLDGPWVNDTVSYGYDVLGRLVGMQVQGGRSLAYVYDTLNRLTRIREGSQEYIYAYPGVSPRVGTLTRPDGSTTQYDYNDLGQLTGLGNRNGSATVVSSHNFTYNGQDLRESETIAGLLAAPAATAGLEVYDYNHLNQLLSKSGPDQSFGYDADGNMTRGYTPEGFLFTASYDAENRLREISYTDGAATLRKMVYLYRGDGFLAQVSRYANGTLAETTRIVRGPYLDLQDRGADNAVQRDYFWGLNLGGGIGGLLSLKQGGQGYSYLYDGTGNVTALLNGAGQIAAAYRYDAFGKLLAQSGSLEQPFQFSTKRYDPGTGLNYYGYRFYAPTIGRWMNRDPLGEAGGINLYGMVSNNPVNGIDPWGLEEYPDNFIGPLPGNGYRSSDMTQTKCGRIPPAPPWALLDSNMSQADGSWDPTWFYNKVRNGGEWDYKQNDPVYEDFGNFNFGASGAAFGIPGTILKRGAGWANQQADPTRTGLGSPFGRSPYGDDWQDQYQIGKGIDYCECMGY